MLTGMPGSLSIIPGGARLFRWLQIRPRFNGGGKIFFILRVDYKGLYVGKALLFSYINADGFLGRSLKIL